MAPPLFYKKKQMYTGLLVQCPYGTENEGCPFCAMRKEGLYAAYKKWSMLNDKEKNGLIYKHQCCSVRVNNLNINHCMAGVENI
jgi:hypothetical protein